jgi:sugar diacid utilization regulator
MKERLCVPARDAGGLRGYLWLFEHDGTIDADGLRRAEAAARTAAGLLAGRERPRTWLRDDGVLLTALLSPREDERVAAVTAVPEDRLPAASPLVAALVAARDERIESAVVLARLGAALSSGYALAGTVGQDPQATMMVVVALADPALSALHPAEVSGHLLRVLHNGRQPPGVAVGQSAPFAGLGALPGARRQAAIALRVARSREPGATHAAWDALRADRLVAQLPPDAWDAVPARLAGLVRNEPTLRGTLAAYLEAAGDVQATAGVLSLHRSGVYYRLRRIEALTGLDLGRGADRLTAHLALRLAALV